MSFKVLYEGGNGEIIEKKSRFIGTTMPVSSEEEAISFINSVRKKYYDARHNCYAYVIGDHNEIIKQSDDGEPSQTAGKPMLDVLLKEEIHNTCVVVTRYFGGTLLGTGGLVRAYTEATKEALEHSVVLERKEGIEIQIRISYDFVGKLQYLCAGLGYRELSSEYTDLVCVSYLIPADQKETFLKKVTEATNARAEVEILDKIFYSDDGKNFLLDV